MSDDHERHPVAGVDYLELLEWFPDNWACLEYLERLRWPGGFVCPACRGRCILAHRQVAAPLATWFAAIWFVTSQKNGVSALGLLVRDRVRLAAQAAPRHGQARPGPAVRDRRGRRGDGRRALTPMRAGTRPRLADMGCTHHYTTGYNVTDPTSVLPGVHLIASLLKTLARWHSARPRQRRAPDMAPVSYLCPTVQSSRAGRPVALLVGPAQPLTLVERLRFQRAAPPETRSASG